MDRDLKELLSALNAQRVKYMVVGGYAVGVHAQPRVTKDIDIFIEMSEANAAAVYAALAVFGAPLGDISIDDFLNLIRSRYWRSSEMYSALPSGAEAGIEMGIDWHG